jgi:hypothetical protein
MQRIGPESGEMLSQQIRSLLQKQGLLQLWTGLLAFVGKWPDFVYVMEAVTE